MSVTLKKFFKEIQKEIDKGEKAARTKAAQHLVKIMKEKVSRPERSEPGEPPGKFTGNLQKGIRYQNLPGETLVGVGPPAYHAHLAEFGTVERVTKKGKKVGRELPRPFVLPTFEEEKEEVKRIMSEQWF